MASKVENSEIIVTGPEFSASECLTSVAEYLVPKMKTHPKDLILQVDCATNESITCEKFLRQTMELAKGLADKGLKEGDVIAVMGPNSIRQHVTAIGVIFSGGILVNFDEDAKAADLQHLLKQSRPRFVFCLAQKREEVRTASKAVNLDPTVILLDSAEPVSGFSRWEDFRADVDYANYVPRKVADSKKSIVLICFSSGTTGWPKGVAISHYSVVNNMVMMEKLEIRGKNENILFTSPLHWVSGFIFLMHSCTIGRTRYVPRSRDPEHFLEALQHCKPSFFLLAPHSLLALVKHPNFKKYDVSSVKLIFSAGGTLGDEILAEIKKNWSGVVLCNVYGSTETFGGITFPPQSAAGSKAIGKLAPGVSVKVVDPSTGKSLGPNKTGELRVKGKRVMMGYYHDEEATRAAFDEQGWYRTGDLVYYDEDELFHFAGRIKEVIQYQNRQISPTELESFLMCLPGVKDVAIVPIPHPVDDNHIRALVVKQENAEITAEDIIRAVKDNFVTYKHLTGGVQFVRSLPRTAIGKLRRVEAQKMVDKSEN